MPKYNEANPKLERRQVQQLLASMSRNLGMVDKLHQASQVFAQQGVEFDRAEVNGRCDSISDEVVQGIRELADNLREHGMYE